MILRRPWRQELQPQQPPPPAVPNGSNDDTSPPTNNNHVAVITTTASSSSSTTRSNQRDAELLVMAQRHMVALVVFLYGIYSVCRWGFGWTPGSGSPPPPSVTVYVNWNALVPQQYWSEAIIPEGGGEEEETKFLVIKNTTKTNRQRQSPYLRGSMMIPQVDD